MIVKIGKFAASGRVVAPSSKSEAHRYLIAAALKKGETIVNNVGFSDDVLITAECLRALGAKITFSDGNASVYGIEKAENGGCLNVSESGSSLRFLMPVVAALGVSAKFVCGERLIERPSGELLAELVRHGEKIEKTADGYVLSGKITSGDYVIPCGVSSQFASGLLFALPLLKGESALEIAGEKASNGYIEMTEKVLAEAGIEIKKAGNKSIIRGENNYMLPSETVVSGDWSAAAFLFCLGAISGDVTVCGLFGDKQGDRKILDILKAVGADVTVSSAGVRVRKNRLKPTEQNCSDIPDLVPPLCALLAYADGKSTLYGIDRLRFKESDRVAACRDMLKKAGIKTDYNGGVLDIYGGNPKGGVVFDGFSDHRMVMASAVLASNLSEKSEVMCAEKTAKSYPDFFGAIEKLGGKVDVGV